MRTLEQKRKDRKLYSQRHPEIIRAQKARYYANHKEEIKNKAKQWKKDNPKKDNAHDAVFRMTHKGNFVKPTSCMFCPKENVLAHHPDYAQPYYVIWVCSSHHQQIHRGILQIPQAV